jgi:hypothetical protein
MLATTLAPVSAPALPLGDQDLAETRTTQTLARGVTLTSIVRGTDPASADEINTTTRGPWRVQVLTIDPRTARGHLKATYGQDLAGTETVTDLVRSSGALAGVNASFFTFTASQLYPGTPVGLGLWCRRWWSSGRWTRPRPWPTRCTCATRSTWTAAARRRCPSEAPWSTSPAARPSARWETP